MAAAEGQELTARPFAYREPRLQPEELWVRGGPPHPASSPESVLVLAQEHRPPFWGHVAFFGTREPLKTLFPVWVGYEPPPRGPLSPSNTDVLRMMKDKGALAAYVHAFSGEPDPLTQGLGVAKSFLVDAALGTADALEWSVSGRASFFPWYAALNNGLRITAIGGEDTITNLHISRLVGSIRTYVYTGQKSVDAAAWWDGVAKGRAFVTTGPLVELTVNGTGPGDEVALQADGGEVELVARVRSITPLQKILLVKNGEVIEEIPLDAERKSADFTKKVRVEQSAWLHLRAEGVPSERYPLDAIYAQAFTNPVWVSVGGRPVRNKAAAEYALKWIETLQIMAAAWPGWDDKAGRDHVFAQLEEARAVYRRFAREAEAAPAGSR
jgi:TolB protein